MRRFCFVLAIATAVLAGVCLAQLAPTAGPYKATKTKVGGEGGTDYIYADANARRRCLRPVDAPANRHHAGTVSVQPTRRRSRARSTGHDQD